MQRVAVFVDAGYLFAGGATALTGSTKRRKELDLNHENVIRELMTLATQKAESCQLLRIYWYDGVAGNTGPSVEQEALARLDHVKIRLGFINSQGQQKGVDSLIVTDLVELARNGSISDAILLSGDEDVRIGVEIAQKYGVRVHLIGIEPARASQSNQLILEADTHNEISKDHVGKFLSHNPAISSSSKALGASPVKSANTPVDGVIEQFFVELSDTDIKSLIDHWKILRDIPREFDAPLLGKCRDKIDRALSEQEKRDNRLAFRRVVEKRHAAIS